MFISKRKLKRIEDRIEELERQVREIDSGYTVYEKQTETGWNGWLYVSRYKKCTAAEVFDLIFEKLGVRPQYVPDVKPRIELVKPAKK